MQGARRKITKKELKEDQLVTFYFNARKFIDKNGKTLGIGLGAVVVLIILTGFVINSKKQSNLKAGFDLYSAAILVERGEHHTAKEVLQTSIESYAGTGNAAIALLKLADAYYNTQEFDSTVYFADEFLHVYRGKDDILMSSGYNLKASALEELGKLEEAAEAYLMVSAKFPHSCVAPISMIDAGRCYNMLGNDEKAREIYMRAINEYGDSKIIKRANEQLARAGGEPVKTEAKMKLF